MNLKILASSAKSKISEFLIVRTISLINRLKRSGEKWSPWGTPEITGIELETKFLYFTSLS